VVSEKSYRGTTSNMCGLAGFLNENGFNIDQANTLAMNMGVKIAHRGPDDEGVWVDANAGIALVHRRLSILDLSSAGHQPMVSSSGRYIIVFNGEIYNHLDIRSQIRNCGITCSWNGHSDTETLLAGFDLWGIQSTIEKTIGMFAFAVWDVELQILTLGRDRIGEKPLYYGWQENTFLFGSELKALKSHPCFKADINRDAICLLLRHNCIPTPFSIYQGINKLESGCLLSVSLANRKPKIWNYWSAINVAKLGTSSPYIGSSENAVDELEHLLKDAISQQMMSDVPLGAFLSGGIDSSTVVALMQSLSSSPIKTFSIGFTEQSYNEALHAKMVANHLGTDHTELYVQPAEAIAVIPLLPSLYDEPFSDSSQIPTFLVSQLAKQHVTVSLSGDAGDELFCGYNRYQITSDYWSNLSRIPKLLRKYGAKSITSLSPQTWDILARFIPRSKAFANFGDKLHKGAEVLTSSTVDDLYLNLVSHHREPNKLVIGDNAPWTLLNNSSKMTGLSDVQRMMLLDLVTYLPDDILVKVDRAAMSVSLETRVPFLDHRIVEFAWSLPQAIKLRNGQTKWPLRQVLSRYVPNSLIERPKMGFSIPLNDWLRGPLRDWADALLNESRIRREGYFYPEPIRKLWNEHQSRKCNWGHLLWNVLMFQAWLEYEIITR